MDNVIIERLWRSVKHEEVYLKAYDTVKQAKQSIAEYLDLGLRKQTYINYMVTS